MRDYIDTNLSMSYRVPHPFAEEAQYDFTGVKIPYGDPKNPSYAEFLVVVLPASGFLYAEAIASQKTQDVLPAYANSLKSFGGVPRVLRIDNFKAAVTEANLFGGELSADMDRFARFFNVQVYASRPYHAKDKGCCEAHVKYVTHYALATMKHEIKGGLWFTSIKQINEHLRPLVQNINERPRRGMLKSRKEMFEQYEKPLLNKPISWNYQYVTVQEVSVPTNCRIIFGQHQYALPATCNGQKVTVEFEGDLIRFIKDGTSIATYQNKNDISGLSALKGFIPENYLSQDIFSIKPQRPFLMEWAEKIGPNVRTWASKAFESKKSDQNKTHEIVAFLSIPNAIVADYELFDQCVKEQLDTNTATYIPSIKHIKKAWNKVDKSLSAITDQIYNIENYRVAGKSVIFGQTTIMQWTKGDSTEPEKMESEEFLNGSDHYSSMYSQSKAAMQDSGTTLIK